MRETQVRQLLRDKAEEMRIPPELPRSVLRRARRRRVATVVMAGVMAAGVALGGAAGLRAALVAEPPIRPADPQWKGVWPQATRAEAEAAQAAADAGDPGAVWQLDAEEVIRRYGVEVLEWEAVYFEQDPWEADALVVVVGTCPQVATERCPFEIDITIERLVRTGPEGIYVVTDVEVIAEPDGATGPTARTLVRDFMQVRRAQAVSSMADLISAEARAQYDQGEGGLSLYGPTDDPEFQDLEYRILSVAPSEHGGALYLAHVEVTQRFDGGRAVTVTESLAIGPGTSYRGDQLPLVINGAQVVSPEPGPTEDEAADLVTAFLEGRLAGSGADRFLTEVAAQQYASHEGGLYLYGEEHDPGLGGNYRDAAVVAVEAVDANSFEVVVSLRVEWLGDSVPSDVTETLFVGPEEIGLMIRGAVRNEG